MSFEKKESDLAAQRRWEAEGGKLETFTNAKDVISNTRGTLGPVIRRRLLGLGDTAAALTSLGRAARQRYGLNRHPY
jgi:hypothetical protein